MKRRNIAYALIFFLCACITHDVQAQKLWRMLKHNDSIMSQRYRSGNIDTLYITRPSTRWTLTGRINVSGAKLKMEGKQMGIPFRSEMTADYKSTISLGVNYLGVTLSMALNPAKLLGKYKDFEINLNSYNNRWGFDFIYQDARNFKGWHETEGQSRLELPPEVLTLKSLNVNAYYAFNHRRFSYPAAFTQSYIQRRSAGSWLAGFCYQGGSIKTNKELKERSADAPEVNISVGHFGIGGGYAYNWVLGKGWLIHFSMLPTVVVYDRDKLTMRGERKQAKNFHFNMIFNEHVAIVRNFSSRYYTGATLVMNNSVFDDNIVVVNQNKWRARAFFGVRF